MKSTETKYTNKNLRVDGPFKCDRCNRLAFKINGYIEESKRQPPGYGCNCYGSMFIDATPSEIVELTDQQFKL